MKRRRTRDTRKGRIEIIPMIDVMFFLLATFMLASLSMQNLNSLPVNLPQGKAESLAADQPLTLTLTRDRRLLVNKIPVTLANLAAVIRPLLRGEGDLIVAADNEAPQGLVVQAMLAARQAGARHFLIAVQHAAH